jgi:hypothetical protein
MNILLNKRSKLLLTVTLCFMTTSTVHASQGYMEEDKSTNHPNALRQATEKLVITGGGIIGALHTFFAHKEAEKFGRKLRVTINEKNQCITETTACRIFASITALEASAVVPQGKELIRKSSIKFSEPGGIRIDDVPGIKSAATERFMEDAVIYSQDEHGLGLRQKAMLELGKFSMDQWQRMYDEADETLKGIFERANFNPCREPRKAMRVLHDGYRIDLIQKFPNAIEQAIDIKLESEGIGYKNCALLSPQDVVELDPFLADFVKCRSTPNGKWQDDAAALWRSGGCLDASKFLPEFYTYLRSTMGQYLGKSGRVKDCFRLKLNREVVSVDFAMLDDQAYIQALRFMNGKKQVMTMGHPTRFVFCTGEAVGTLSRLGIKEPSYTAFASVSLRLNIPLSEEEIPLYKTFNHCMEVHQPGVVLAWQARYVDGQIVIGGAGTKALYGEAKPTIDQEFALTNNLKQLQMFNDVLPQFISKALDRPTMGQTMTHDDLRYLERKGIAKRWAGRRAVAFDGIITAGPAYLSEGIKLANTLITKDLGSGGVSFGPGAVIATWCSEDERHEHSGNPAILNILKYSQTDRNPNYLGKRK